MAGVDEGSRWSQSELCFVYLPAFMISVTGANLFRQIHLETSAGDGFSIPRPIYSFYTVWAALSCRGEIERRAFQGEDATDVVGIFIT